MVQCTQWYSAEDNNGNDMPGTVYADLESWNGSFWEHVTTLTIPKGLPTSTSIQKGDEFRVVPEAVSGYITPSVIEFTACGIDIRLIYVKPCPSPSIASIHCDDTTPTTGQLVSFWRNGEYGGDGQYVVSRLWEFGDGGTATTSSATHTYTVAGTYTVKYTIVNDCGGSASKTLTVVVSSSENGFKITVAPSLNGKPLIVWHAIKFPWVGMTGPDPNLWFSAFAWVRGTWNSASSSTTYKVKTGDISETSTPTFDEVSRGTLGDAKLHDGDDCVVLARETTTLMEFGIFEEKDIFKIYSDSVTEINLITASNDVLATAFMGPVCDLFGIPIGPECEAFWADFYDPIFVANYISILKNKKDLLGNERELSWFDHIALPFAIIGSLPVLNIFPLGAFVSKGLRGVSKFKFTDEAIGWMHSTTVPNIPTIIKPNIEHGPVKFFQALIQLTGAHADEVLGNISKGDLSVAKLKLDTYFKLDYGKTTLGDYKLLFQKLRDGMPDDEAFIWCLEASGFSRSTLAAVLNTLQKITPSASELSDASKLMDDAGILGKAADAVYDTLGNLKSAPNDLISYVRNVLKNSPTVSAHVIAKHESILNKVIAGTGDITKDEVLTILNHCEMSPSGIHSLLESVDVAKLIPKLADGNYKQVLGNFIDLTDSQYDNVATLGKPKVDKWMIDNAKLSNKALTASDPAAMSKLACDAQKVTADTGKIIDDVCGSKP